MRNVLIVDDHEVVRDGVKNILGEQARAISFGEASTAPEALRLITEQNWDLVILDLSLAGRNGLELLKQLKQIDSELPVLILSMHSEEQYARRAFKAGAAGYVTKDSSRTELIEAVKRALERSEEQLRHRGERQDARGRVDKLTPREFEVLRFVVMGLLNKQIASELHTAEKTIKVHRGRVMQKLGVTSVPDLVRVSQRAGVVPDRNRA